MKFLRHMCAFAFMFITVCLNAQEMKEVNAVERMDPLVVNYEWLPTLLNANSNPLYNAVIYNGHVFSWSLRAEQNTAIILDGINWNSPLTNWRSSDLFAGSQKAFHTEEVLVNGAFSDRVYFPFSTFKMETSKAGLVNTNSLMSLGFSNSMYTNGLRWHHNSTANASGWSNNIDMNLQYTEAGFVYNGYAKVAGVLLSMDKDFDKGLSLGWSIIWNYSDKSKATTTVKEAYDLVKQKTYNPGWGWYHGKLVFPNTKQSNAPVISLRISKAWGENNLLNFDNAFVYGIQSESGLTWTQSADPRPDYYRYLPSYSTDSSLQNSLRDWFQAHPESLQINFEKLEKTNTSSRDKQSFYVINQQSQNLLLMHGSLNVSHGFNSNLNLLFGTTYLVEQIHTTNTIKDLLGGNYYYNYNNWINDDGAASSFQNDIVKPDRKIKQDENWGANYLLNALQVHPWIQLNKQGPYMETYLALGYGMEGIQRTGINQNGLFPSLSKGAAAFNYFPYWDIKAQLLYKFSGRFYARSIAYEFIKAPIDKSIFIDENLHHLTNPFLIPQVEKGFDLTFFYRAPNFKASVGGYLKNLSHQTEQKMFYHDAYTAFVYGMIGNMNLSYSGIETSIETNIFSNVQVTYVSTLAQDFYSNDPGYQILLVNDLHLLESGILHLKSIKNTNSPSIVNVLSFQYQPAFSTRIGMSFVYAQDRSVALDYYRRSDWVKNKLDPISWGQILRPAMLPNKMSANMFLSKSFQMKWPSLKLPNRLLRFNTSLNIRNCFDAFIPILAYEQSRFDYVHFNPNKYAIKYLLDQGATYSLHIQLQIQ